MIVNGAQKMTELLQKNNLISKEQRELYQYSFELLLSTVINLLLVLFLGFLFDAVWETILFLLFFCPLKRFTGGFHMPDYRSCICFFCVLYCMLLFGDRFLSESPFIGFALCPCVLSGAVFLFLAAPVESSHKKLTRAEKKRLTFKVRLLLFPCTLSFLFFFELSDRQTARFIGYALLLTAFLTALGHLQNKWEERNDSYSNV